MRKNEYIQVLRGVSILAVVLIHCLPPAFLLTVAIRPFLNFAVPLFIFLSGYLTTPDKCDKTIYFYRHRIGKVLPPYLLWSFLYLAAAGQTDIIAIIKALLIGSARGQLYYLVVYIQLVLISPLLWHLLVHKFFIARLLYWITPMMFLIRYMAEFLGAGSMHLESFCGTWLIYYLIGLEWRSKIVPRLSRFRYTTKRGIALLGICLLIQEIEGFIWYSFGYSDFAISQQKISVLLSAVAFILVSMKVTDKFKQCASSFDNLKKWGTSRLVSTCAMSFRFCCLINY